MNIRAVVVISLPLTLSACASDGPAVGQFVPTSSFATASIVAPAAASVDAQMPTVMPKKTMSDKVLTAIALERVTGLKPDPARLTP